DVLDGEGGDVLDGDGDVGDLLDDGASGENGATGSDDGDGRFGDAGGATDDAGGPTDVATDAAPGANGEATLGAAPSADASGEATDGADGEAGADPDDGEVGVETDEGAGEREAGEKVGEADGVAGAEPGDATNGAAGADGDPDDSAFEFGAVEDGARDAGERPYLPALPAGLRADATAMAWLSYLVERGGHAGAVEALRYYRRIGWIGPAAEEGLVTLLGGVGGDGATGGGRVRAEADGGVAGLGPEDHRRSLEYIGRLSDVPADRLLARTGGVRDGVQR
ncbi:MAG: FlaD/FlaE family flagellar protein, partial [Haloferacaceae archaeon]